MNVSVMRMDDLSSTRRLVITPTLKPFRFSTMNHNFSQSPTQIPKFSSPQKTAKHNQFLGTGILIFLLLSVAYMISIITIIQRKKRRRIQLEAQRISMTAHPSRPLHPMSQEAIVV